MTSLTSLLWRHYSATMTSLLRSYDVTNHATMTSLLRYYDVTTPLLWRHGGNFFSWETISYITIGGINLSYPGNLPYPEKLELDYFFRGRLFLPWKKTGVSLGGENWYISILQSSYSPRWKHHPVWPSDPGIIYIIYHTSYIIYIYIEREREQGSSNDDDVIVETQ